MKKLLSLLMISALVLSIAACSDDSGDSSESADASRELYIRDDSAKKVSVRFSDTESRSEETVEAELVSEGDDYNTFMCEGDPEKYDRAVIISDDEESVSLAFNEFVSGWHISPYGAEPFVYDEEEADIHTFETRDFEYNDSSGGGIKSVYVWTPSGYDKNSDEKYSVIYMTDGQNLFNRTSTSYGSWGVCESVEAYMSLGGKKTIVVGIDDSTGNRDSELTPDIGGKVTAAGYENGTGKEFSDFVVNEVMPYVEKNYNVYTDKAHTAVCGSSSGGIESFYIGMEHPDKFGLIGALSPAFGLYEDADWVKYLSEKDFTKDAPLIYIYCGKGDALETWLYPGAKSMADNLKSAASKNKKASFPEKNIIFRDYEEGLHNEAYWRAVFPEVLSIFDTVK